jgi:hypothetical protein
MFSHSLSPVSTLTPTRWWVVRVHSTCVRSPLAWKVAIVVFFFWLQHRFIFTFLLGAGGPLNHKSQAGRAMWFVGYSTSHKLQSHQTIPNLLSFTGLSSRPLLTWWRVVCVHRIYIYALKVYSMGGCLFDSGPSHGNLPRQFFCF